MEQKSFPNLGTNFNNIKFNNDVIKYSNTQFYYIMYDRREIQMGKFYLKFGCW